MINKTLKASPIFIGGLYKSGTSLLRAMLGQHSNIAGGLETFWFDLDFSGRAESGDTTRNWDATRIEPLEKHIKRLADFYDIDIKFALKIAEESSIAEEFIDRFMNEYTIIQGKQRWVEKTPANVLHIERIFSYWPNSFFIYVVRDPRDVYSSMKRAGKWDDPEVFARLWIKFIAAYESARKTFSTTQIFEVRYEDVVLKPNDTMNNILVFINETWEDKVADFSGDPTGYLKVREVTGKSSSTLEQLSKPLVSDRVQIWKKELEKSDDLLKLENIIKESGFWEIWEHSKYQ